MIKTYLLVKLKIFFLIIFIFSAVIYGLGISTEFNNIFIENLQIGQEYDLTKDFNLPFKAKYSGETRATIKLEIVQPSNLKIGFESIPDTRWIKFSNNEISVLPEGNVYSDIKIKIPDDKTLLGKKFQANIRCYVSSLENSNFISVTPGVEGSFLFSISQDTKKNEKLNR